MVDAMQGYTREQFVTDVMAGITVGVVALPLAMAFAIASGVTPEAGIFTAIIAGLIIAALGGSRVQIGGPAGAFIVIIYGIIQQYGLANLLIATMLAGVLLFVMGLLRIGSLIRFIPVPIVIGFTNGIAVLIALSQIKDFLGLTIEKMPADFVGILKAVGQHIDTINPTTVALACASLVVVVGWSKAVAALARRSASGGAFKALGRVPGTIIALVLATLAVVAFGLPVETIGSRFGGIPQGLPAFALPEFDWDKVRNLVAPTITIALLGAIESLLCARVADAMIDDRHDPNQELMAQGIANFAVPFFGGIPATGTIARTTTNARAGARTPIAGIVHAVTLLVIVLVAAPLAMNVPLAALAAILMFVAWNMGEWREFARLKRFPFKVKAVMLTTFFLTVVFDLTVAVQVGLVLACLFFIVRTATLTQLTEVKAGDLPSGLRPREGVAVYRIFGSLFFGAVDKLETLLDPTGSTPAVVVLDLHYMISLDSSGLDTLEALHRTLHRRGSHLVLADLQAEPRALMESSGFADAIGRENILPTLAAALGRADALTAAAAGGDVRPAATAG
jgi:SulP family sulfate permease